jgi:hypothetical protein
VTDRPTWTSPEEASGNPFKTADLINLRWEQRRQLRLLPAGLARETPSLEPAIVPDGDRQLVEHYVRGLAKIEATRCAAYFEQRAVEDGATLLGKLWFEVQRDLNSTLRGLCQEVHDARAASMSRPNDDMVEALIRFAFLAYTADLLADDK